MTLNFFRNMVFILFLFLTPLCFSCVNCDQDDQYGPKSLNHMSLKANSGDQFCQDQLVSMAAINPTIASNLLAKVNIMDWPNLQERVLYNEGYSYIVGMAYGDAFRKAYPNFYTLLNFPQDSNSDPLLISHNKALIDFFGLAGKVNYDKAMEKLRLTADQGYAPSQVFLSGHILSSIKLDANILSKIKEWVLAANVKNHPMASYLLGQLKLIEGDVESSIFWYHVAMSKGIKISEESVPLILNPGANTLLNIWTNAQR